MTESYYLMNDDDIVFGWLPGVIGELPPPAGDVGTPRQALENVLRRALQRPPCGIAFSGGVDSSLLLAVATHVARRDGLPEPIPITRVFPDLPETDESEYQEMVIRHLGLTEWRRVELTDEVDIVGPAARRILLDHGVVWPPAIAATIPLLDGLAGGTLLDGEGGDEVLSVVTHRVANLASLRLAPRPLRWWRVKAAIGAIAPYEARRKRAVRNHLARDLSWLRPQTRQRVARAAAEHEMAFPLSFAAGVRLVPCWRGQALGGQNRRILAGQRNVDLRSPLLEPDVVHAIADHGGFIGPGGRQAFVSRIAPDLLPAAIWSRRDKARFNRAYIGAHARSFVEQWSGAGVDDSVVDTDCLRTVWLSETPPSTTGALLQQAWLADRGNRDLTASLRPA